MGIQLSSTFDMNSALPLDSRDQVADLTIRDAIPAGKRWQGMKVFVISEQKTYELKTGLTNADWVELGAGGGGGGVGVDSGNSLEIASLAGIGVSNPAKRVDSIQVIEDFVPSACALTMENRAYDGSFQLDVRKDRWVNWAINKIEPHFSANITAILDSVTAGTLTTGMPRPTAQVSTTSIARTTAQISTTSIARGRAAMQIAHVVREKDYTRYVLTAAPDADLAEGDSVTISSCQVAANNGTFTVLSLGSATYEYSILVSNTAGVTENNIGGDDNFSYLTNLGVAAGITNVNCLAVQSDGKVIIGGDFTTWNGLTRNRIVRLNADGTEDSSFYSTLVGGTGAGFNAQILAIKIQPDGKILVGGGFSTLNAVARVGLVRLESTGQLDLSFSINLGALNGNVNAITMDASNNIYIGGAFTTRAALTRNRILKLDSTGTEDATFVTNMGTAFALAVNALEYDSFTNTVYVGGDFTAYGATTNKNKIVRLNLNGTLDTGFVQSGVGLGATASQGVWALKADGAGNVYAGGLFVTYATEAGWTYFMKFTSIGAPDTAFQQRLTGRATGAIDNQVRTIEYDPSTGLIFVGGLFTIFNRHASVNRFAVLNSSGSISYKHKEILGTTGFGGGVFAIQAYDSGEGTRVYVGGAFTAVAGLTYNRFMRFGTTDLVIQKGKIDQNIWVYNYAAAVSTEFVVGETAKFATHTSAGNNGDFTIYAVNRDGNNIWVKNSGGVAQAGAVGNCNTNRWKYAGAYTASLADFTKCVGENIKMASHTTPANNGNFPLKVADATGMTVLNAAGVAQAGAAGNVRSNRINIYVTDDLSPILAGYEGTELWDITIRGCVTAANNGNFTIKEYGTYTSGFTWYYLTIYNESGVEQSNGGNGEVVSKAKRIYCDQDFPTELANYPSPWVELNFTESSAPATGNKYYPIWGSVLGYIIIFESSIVRQYGPSGYIEVISASIFGTNVTITTDQANANGYLVYRGTNYEEDLTPYLNAYQVDGGSKLGLWIISNNTTGAPSGLKVVLE